MDETNWSSDFYSDALESFSYTNKYSKTEILAVFHARPIWNYSPDYPLNCTPLSPITTTNYVPSVAVQDITNETEIKCKINSSNKHVSRPKWGWLASHPPSLAFYVFSFKFFSQEITLKQETIQKVPPT